MGGKQDILQEVPLAAVLREQVALADQKYEQAIAENEKLRTRIAELQNELADARPEYTRVADAADDLTTDVWVVLLFLGKNDNNVCHAGSIAEFMNVEAGVVKYHLEVLQSAQLAEPTGGNHVDGHTYWGLTEHGRTYVVGNDLLTPV